MPSLGFAATFFTRYPDLPKEVQKRIPELIEKFQTTANAGMHLEKPHAIADPRARTIRVNRFWRGVVMAPTQGDTYLLYDVLPHDDAYAWCASHKFVINSATREVEVVNVAAMTAATATLAAADGAQADDAAKQVDPIRLYDGYSDADLLGLGISAEHLPAVRLVRNESDLDILVAALPERQATVLEMLASGYTVREARDELGVLRSGAAAGEPGATDMDASPLLGSPTVFIPRGARELQEALDHPLEKWRIFLHPYQRQIAYRDRYTGSVRVTGGAGTGKTVVALHRAHHLARRLPADARRPVLLTTFVRTLADQLRANLASLDAVTGVDTTGRIEVTTIDALAMRIVTEVEGAQPAVIRDDSKINQLWADAAQSVGATPPLTPAMLRQEWEQVILARGVQSKADYLTVTRQGRTLRLTTAQRAQVWAATEHFLAALAKTGDRTFYQVADAASRYAAKLPSNELYRHVVVDEAQDLHPVQWRLLRAIVPPGPDDLFIVGDAHQRIYDHRVALTTLGINVRGRSYRLRLNYRTTEEILTWAVSLLHGREVDDMDAGVDSLEGYRSAFRGTQPPKLRGYPDRDAELTGLVSTVRGWIAGGIDPSAIGVAARTNKAVDAALAALKGAGISASALHWKIKRGVEVGTMHRMKGLEYRAVAVIDVSDGTVPGPYAVTPATEDAAAHAADTLRELCLLYVACTRAREYLSVSWSGEPSPFIKALVE